MAVVRESNAGQQPPRRGSTARLPKVSLAYVVCVLAVAAVCRVSSSECPMYIVQQWAGAFLRKEYYVEVELALWLSSR